MSKKVTENDLVFALAMELNGHSYIYDNYLEIAYQKISASYCDLSNINADVVKIKACGILQLECIRSGREV